MANEKLKDITTRELLEELTERGEQGAVDGRMDWSLYDYSRQTLNTQQLWILEEKGPKRDEDSVDHGSGS